MTTKQNAIDLAKTARSEAAAIANGTKRTITQIITNWNECVGQAGFMCIYDFPTTGYSRKSQIADDLIRCAAQLDDYCEPNPHAPQTVEQQTREINAALTRVLDADEAHSEALKDDEKYQAAIKTIADNLTLPVWDGCSETVKCEVVKAHHAEALQINNAYNMLYVYAPGNVARDVWPQLTEIERAVSVEFAHKQALHENQQHDDAIAYFASLGSHLWLEAFSQNQIKQIADFCHSDALEINSSLEELA